MSQPTEKQKMLAGALYNANSPEIQADQAATRAWLARYNAGLAHAPSAWHRLFRKTPEPRRMLKP